MQQTEKYGFNIIEGGDDFSPVPLNENMEKVEEVLGALDAGMLRYQFYTYQGDASKTLTLNFDFEPLMVFIVPFRGVSYGAGILIRGQTEGMPVRTTSGNDCYAAKWEGNTLTLTVNPVYSSYASCLAVFQSSGLTYGVFALG